MTEDEANATAANVILEFEALHGVGESRGACQTIAQKICEIVPGSVLRCGHVVMPQGRAMHWWAELDGVPLDPLAEKWFDKPFRHEALEANPFGFGQRGGCGGNL